MSKLFEPLNLRGLTLRNRIGLSPMCMYSCDDGYANDLHVVHLGAQAAGGVGLVMTEATAVLPNGRISPQDLGLWHDGHIEPLRRVTSFIRDMKAARGIQLAHAGRKAGTYRPWSPVRGYVPESDGGWTDRVSPTPVAFRPEAPTPLELSTDEIEAIVEAFARAADRAHRAGFDLVEIHAAHGYLLHQFLSPLSNRRSDSYGGDFAGRTRIVKEVAVAIRRVWPEEKPLAIRISATDWVEGGWTVIDSVQLARDLQPLGVDLIDCSSGGATPDASIPTGPGYQVPLAQQIRRESGVPVATVGAITEPEQAEEILATGDVDLVMIGRELLRNPNWPRRAAAELGAEPFWPDQYAWCVGPGR